MKLKKILVISHQSNKSGAPLALIELFDNLPLNKFNLFFIINQYQEAIGEFQSKFKTFFFLPDRFSLMRKIMVKFNIFFFLKRLWFKTYLFFIKPELIYINTIGYNEFTRVVVSQKKVKYFLHIHETNEVMLNHKHKEFLKLLVENADVVISCSKYVQNFTNSLYNIKKNQLIYGPINTKRFQNVNLKIQFENNSIKSVLKVGFVGSPIYIKGLDIIINAFNCINKKLDKNLISFTWVGVSESDKKSEYYKDCLDKIESFDLTNFHFKNTTNDISSFYNEIDLFVIASRVDSFPLSLLEAMFLKTPIIGSDTCGIPEALSGNCGILFEKGNYIELANLIIDFYNSTNNYKDMIDRGYEKCLSNFTSEIASEKLSLLFEKELLNNKN